MSHRTWYYDGHPPTCTCVGCVKQRSKGLVKFWTIRFLFDILIAIPSRYMLSALRRLGII